MESKTAKKIKNEAMLRIPRQIGFRAVTESAYNAQNAYFGLVMGDMHDFRRESLGWSSFSGAKSNTFFFSREK